MSEQNDSQNNRSIELCKRVVTTESFIAEAKEIYGDRYDYSKVDYKNKEHRVTVICPVHGDFQVFAREHLDGKGCPKCEKGEKFIKKLKDKFGEKFGLEKFVYESSTSPVTLICPTHGDFSRLPNQILNSKFGCPECGNDYQKQLQEESHQAAEAKKEEKRKAREELETQRLMDFENERAEKKKVRDKALKSFQAGKKPRSFFTAFQIYQEIVNEHIDDIRYSAGWREPFREKFRLSNNEAAKLKCYREGDTFYKYPNEAPIELFRESFDKDHSFSGQTMEEYLSHRSCIVSFESNDLIIQVESYEHEQERLGFISPTAPKPVDYSDIPNSFVSIDFETLYSQRISACSIGMVKYKEGQQVATYSSLIKPPFDYPGKSGNVLTWLHGITEEQLRGERTFAELLPEIEQFVEGLPLVAHNASVEKSCFRDTLKYYDIETKIDYENIFDTLSLSKDVERKLNNIVEGQGTHSLDAVCRRFGVEVKNHHNALDDAEMCGGLMTKFYEVLVEGKVVTLNTSESENNRKEENSKSTKRATKKALAAFCESNHLEAERILEVVHRLFPDKYQEDDALADFIIRELFHCYDAVSESDIDETIERMAKGSSMLSPFELKNIQDNKSRNDLTHILESVMERVLNEDVLLSSFPEWNDTLLEYVKRNYSGWKSCYDKDGHFALGKTFNAFYNFWYYDYQNPPFHCYGTQSGDVLFTKDSHQWLEDEKRYDFEKSSARQGKIVTQTYMTGESGQSSNKGCSLVILAFIIASVGALLL